MVILKAWLARHSCRAWKHFVCSHMKFDLPSLHRASTNASLVNQPYFLGGGENRVRICVSRRKNGLVYETIPHQCSLRLLQKKRV